MMEGTDIFNVQKALKDKGFNIKPDGYFGQGTAEIVKQFQTKIGIDADGIVGQGTLTKLFA